MICAYKLFVVAGFVDGWRTGLLVIPGACLLVSLQEAMLHSSEF